MSSTLWRKVMRDLLLNKGRTLLVIAAIAVGVVAAGSILTAYSVITREADRNYLETNPPSAILYLESVDEDLVASVEARPEIAAAEARRQVTARLVKGPEDWTRLTLVVVRDFENIAVSRFYSEGGALSPQDDEILIERSSLTEVGTGVGEDITVAVSAGAPKALTVTGLVHDPSRIPAGLGGPVVGYITPGGLTSLGLEPTLDELQVVTVGDGSRTDNRRFAETLAADVESGGFEVLRVDVPVPVVHPAQDVMKTMLFLLQVFGVIALVTGGALVATLITAQLKQQSREIGVMKAVGARTGQIAGIYLGTVALLGVIALAIGIPLGILGGRGFVSFTFGLLNFDVESYRLDAWVIPLLVVAALGVPLLAVVYPVVKNSRLPVRQVITDHGITTSSVDGGSAGRLLGRTRWLSRTATFGIRNTFRTRSRTLLTVFAISLGGAAFMVALNTGVAWDRAVGAEFDARQYDLEIQLDRAYPAQKLERSLEDLPQVETAEAWNQYPAAMQLPGGGTGDVFALLTPPAGTEMIDYPLLEGRWFRPNEEKALVINQILDDPAPAVGTTVSVDINGTTSSWAIVGIVRQLGGGENGVAYASNLPLGVGTEGSANHIRVAGNGTPSLLSSVERSLAENGIGVVAIATAEAGRESLEEHLFIIVGLLMIMAILIAIVGGLGLIEAMSISVLERRRELGVMRAVGASTAKVLQVVTVEGVLIAVLSWVVALVLSVPATVLVETVTGNIFIQTPLVTSFSGIGAAIWLVVVVLLASVASAIPTLETTEIPVHQALAYE
ncbi:MAG: FtsX-like permease family protein [Actinomycetia bacterium]|nr:FtsX-like permease family protein [Actinomycetes bacterium]